MLIGKNKVESMCRAAGMKPAARGSSGGMEIFIADGFSAPPHIAFRKFGIEQDEFPMGMYATLWWVSKADEKLDIGQPLFFDALHDAGYSTGDKRRMRIKAALKEAESFLSRRKKAH